MLAPAKLPARRLRPAAGSAEQSAGVAGLARKEVLSVRLVAALAILLACAATAVAAAALLPPTAEPGQPPFRDLDVLDVDNATAGWYQVKLNTILRQEASLESARVDLLAMGERVFVAGHRGRRVRIEAPQPGWASLASPEGLVILTREDVDPDKDLRATQELKASALELQAKARRLQGLQQRMRGASKDFPRGLSELLQGQARKAGEAIERGVRDGGKGALRATKQAMEGLRGVQLPKPGLQPMVQAEPARGVSKDPAVEQAVRKQLASLRSGLPE